ncbi:hypothetical protein M2271_006634 [Streptomyces sp. LBL]|uniref:hypothetical protein n=1 Tax=Streptomyces sp. LBL TaxID=2940562 RepID=UPI00247473AD|nr:hypothetical protein [Streptomyces sp. LBL]MDH6628799.1 hypothetical protein [Streptomyces sp. LBL]
MRDDNDDTRARGAATGAIPGLEQPAESGGSSQAAKQARRLRDCLAHEAPATA